MENRLLKLKNARAENIVEAPRVDISFPVNGARFPIMIKPRTAGLILKEWAKVNRQELEQKVRQHGGILFRGFGIDTVEKFQEFIGVFDVMPLEYKQRSSPRFEVAKNIYHSTTYPADQPINMHSENSYALKWAMRIVFCCIWPAEEQGETPIADNRLVYENLSDGVKAKFLQKGVRYIRNMSKGMGLAWQEVFQTSDRAQVEEECRKSGMDFVWKDEDSLMLSWNNGAIYDHPETKEKIWFNHAFFFNKYALSDELLSSFESEDHLPFNTHFGDGSPISREEIEEIRMAYEKATILFSWEKGDVLFLDNMLISHGRSPYKGKREIIVSMF